MKKFSVTLIVLMFSVYVMGSCSQQTQATENKITVSYVDNWDTINKGINLINQKKWDKAIQLFSELVKKFPNDELGWYYLASAYHGKGNYKKAIEINTKAVKYQRVRANGYYNMACAYALLNDRENSLDALQKAMTAGFLDYDLLRNDDDLSLLRKENLIKLPNKHKYESIKAHNGILVKYKIILPDNYSSNKSYPALVAYPPGSQEQTSADWSISKFWGEMASKKGWIIVVPVAPKNGWINHPAHHALNDLLDHIKSNHKIKGGKFHMAGFGRGARPATTFSMMSKQYFQSLTTVSNYSWIGWDDNELREFKIMPVKLIVGEKDSHGLKVAQRVVKQFNKYDIKADLEIISGEGYELPSIRNGVLIDKIESFLD